MPAKYIENPSQAFIDALGKRGDIAAALGVPRRSIDNWVVRDAIPWRYRYILIQMAQGRGVSPPEGFMGC